MQICQNYVTKSKIVGGQDVAVLRMLAAMQNAGGIQRCIKFVVAK